MLADTPKDFKKQTVDVIGTDATSFKDDGYNGTATRAASLLTFVRTIFSLHHPPFPSLSNLIACARTHADNRSDPASLLSRSSLVSSELGSSSLSQQ